MSDWKLMETALRLAVATQSHTRNAKVCQEPGKVGTHFLFCCADRDARSLPRVPDQLPPLVPYPSQIATEIPGRMLRVGDEGPGGVANTMYARPQSTPLFVIAAHRYMKEHGTDDEDGAEAEAVTALRDSIVPAVKEAVRYMAAHVDGDGLWYDDPALCGADLFGTRAFPAVPLAGSPTQPQQQQHAVQQPQAEAAGSGLLDVPGDDYDDDMAAVLAAASGGVVVGEATAVTHSLVHAQVVAALLRAADLLFKYSLEDSRSADRLATRMLAALPMLTGPDGLLFPLIERGGRTGKANEPRRPMEGRGTHTLMALFYIDRQHVPASTLAPRRHCVTCWHCSCFLCNFP